jgi:hypothetical protein
MANVKTPCFSAKSGDGIEQHVWILGKDPKGRLDEWPFTV